MFRPEIKIIDCTVRDGGLMNNWQFSDEFVKDVYNALEDADAMVLMTGHEDFRNLDFQRVIQIMNSPIIIDGRRIYNPDELRDMGFYYIGVGAINR